jgi:dodecin
LSAVVRRNTMTLVKVIEVLAESPNSWEDAAQSAVQQASQTLRGISSIYVKEFEAQGYSVLINN